MKKPTYIVADKQTGVWHFRRRVPAIIHDQVKHKLILRSLNTTDQEKALKQGALLAIASETIFIHLRGRVDRGPSGWNYLSLTQMIWQVEDRGPFMAHQIANCAAWLTAWLREDDSKDESLARMAYAVAKFQLEKIEFEDIS